jgi:hypothetical protein
MRQARPFIFAVGALTPVPTAFVFLSLNVVVTFMRYTECDEAMKRRPKRDVGPLGRDF